MLRASCKPRRWRVYMSQYSYTRSGSLIINERDGRCNSKTKHHRNLTGKLATCSNNPRVSFVSPTRRIIIMCPLRLQPLRSPQFPLALRFSGSGLRCRSRIMGSAVVSCFFSAWLGQSVRQYVGHLAGPSSSRDGTYPTSGTGPT